MSQPPRRSPAAMKPSTQKISVRMPKGLIENLQILAKKRDVPYQSLLKIFLGERVDKELRNLR